MTEKEFLALVKEIELLKSTLALSGWDIQTGMPERASEYRAEQNAFLSQLLFERMTGEKMTLAMEYFAKNRVELSELGQKVYDKVKEGYDKKRVIPAEKDEAYNREASKAFTNWIKAREQKDFGLFKDSLANLIAMQKEFITLWRKDEKTPYDVLLNQYEPGMTVEILDEVFGKVREGIMQIRQTIAEKGIEPRVDFLSRKVPKEFQISFAKELSTALGFDFSRGRLDEAVHPFMTGFNYNDARLTSRWNEEDFQMGIFGVLHEQGHGQFEQNVSPDFEYTPLKNTMSMGIHESQSLFQEIMIGSNKSFWKKQYPRFQEICEGRFDDIDFETFFAGLKRSQSSLIRIEADTLTYVLHIIIRYEMEKMMFNENVSVEKLPELWNDKYEEILGIRPQNDLEGILQDVHWTSDFGYFPSYALGYMYASQMKHAMSQTLDFDTLLKCGEYLPIKQWLDENVRVFGASVKPKDVLKNATGEDLNPKYLLEELEKLYFDVYQVG
ncbi:carboxypeptidase Taq [Pilibacter termitis]|uniref:Metal-dependent carboxypeptidase n=1 Tax=Pilibacter termitis TaxID=263852 RepID=A0A1T4LDR3_9ENTE|nr:carboxypeptidase M32 [Pilibacter termitis]SJZ52875.1 carboxypeptidase Taq [Pilibacter termitis]